MSLSSYDETAPGPSSPYSRSQVFPADTAVATVSKDNTFSWISYWKSRCQPSICSAEFWVGWGGLGVWYVTIAALTGSGPSSRIVPHKQKDKRINYLSSDTFKIQAEGCEAVMM